MATHKPALPRTGDGIGIESFIGIPELKTVDVGTRLATFRIRSSSGTGPDAPDYPVPISSILPNSEYDTIEFWKKLVDSLMETLKQQGLYPNFLKGYEVTLDDDSSGDPAIYIKLLVARQESYAHSTVTEWNQFENLLQSSLIRLRVQRYPYVHVIGEKRSRR
jgi:hypothetical protein